MSTLASRRSWARFSPENGFDFLFIYLFLFSIDGSEHTGHRVKYLNNTGCLLVSPRTVHATMQGKLYLVHDEPLPVNSNEAFCPAEEEPGGEVNSHNAHPCAVSPFQISTGKLSTIIDCLIHFERIENHTLAVRVKLDVMVSMSRFWDKVSIWKP